MTNFARLDLNLLVTLDVLLAEHNVTRAAQRLNLSQPAVSVHLAKLREFFGDPLLLPGPRGMLPTVRAEELREPLRQALEKLGHVITPSQVFDPAAARQTWRVLASDYGESTIVLPALAGLRAAAPHSRLAVLELRPASIARQAERGEIDLAFHTLDDAPPGLHARSLFTERYVLAARAGHPQLQKSLTLKRFCRLEHVVVSPNGGGFSGVTDQALSSVGLSRRVALSVPHFLFMVSALLSTDLVAMLPERLVRAHAALQVLEPPVRVPGYEMVMLWHERVHRDPAHRWLREHIAAAL
ncbi:LysR family transcriptional regulator [Ectopseudomonas alcaliphila]|uniref:LysR family transcriptional regulator n=1 Tax=Ectopseudomonas alcaliphila TaxID=101564 RepID=UPI002782911A|nr:MULTISPECIES: LysR family transcriptional regulator [Pseudomonas]MDP9941024.1 DNA-binding transcriptional LysR family regulator [Pseudomonas sp. 3400]MDR7013243.1 DNA-binding transcriptional LysR family regulator [Pseudomonas alcaliphila]